ncbi:MAG TPA: hypothetical protein VLW55_00165 [Burkholderiaceae bacterium]|nr:hypothetical protein [Burkholderiaceae bacterium]
MKSIANDPMEMFHWAQVNRNLDQVRRTILFFQRAILQLRARGLDTEISEKVLATLKESRAALERIRADLVKELSE